MAPEKSGKPFDAAAFLGNVVEICYATRSADTLIRSLHQQGIGPWSIYTFSPANISKPTYHGEPSTYRLKVCFASLPANPQLVFEVIEPLVVGEGAGPNIFDDWLRQRNDLTGVHHIAYDCNGLPWEERLEGFRRMGARNVQDGVWDGVTHFAWFELPSPQGQAENGGTGTYLETIGWLNDGSMPPPEATFPPQAS